MGMSVQRRCSKTPSQIQHKISDMRHLGAESSGATNSSPNATMLLSPPSSALLATSLTDLIGTDPFSLDRPGAAALMIWIVPGKVAMFDQASPRVPALEVNDLELAVSQRLPEQYILCLRLRFAYLAHGCYLWLIGEFFGGSCYSRDSRGARVGISGLPECRTAISVDRKTYKEVGCLRAGACVLLSCSERSQTRSTNRRR